MKSETNSNISKRRKELANARWSILRDALLQKSTSTSSSSQNQQCSIHRFSGYDLLKSHPPASNELGQIKPLIEIFYWNTSYDMTQNIQMLEIAINGLAACFPKGNCLQVIIPTNIYKNHSDWFETLKKECDSSVCIWKVKQEEDENSASDIICVTTTMLVQESKYHSKYSVCLYDLKCCNGRGEEFGLSLWTREPRQTRLSLDDLVSHRKNKGVDNTGEWGKYLCIMLLFALITPLLTNFLL
jgi:hypothetical protein